MIRLRYRLIPYIYSLAGKVTQESYTMSRLLAFDFADDARVHDIKDEFMFGPAFLVCPVTRPMYYDKGSVALQGVEKTDRIFAGRYGLGGFLEWEKVPGRPGCQGGCANR